MRTSWTKLCIDAMNPLSLAPTGVQYWSCEASLIIGIKVICLESPSVSTLALDLINTSLPQSRGLVACISSSYPTDLSVPMHTQSLLLHKLSGTVSEVAGSFIAFG